MGGRVLVLHTGGTIGMEASPDGFRPMPGFGERLAGELPARAGGAVPAFDVVQLDALIDSANLQPEHWATIARALLDRWDDYAGFVVLHGTDTMAWTASALSFMLRGADKPVILTGAQIPLLAPRSDAVANLHTALLLAAEAAVREVCVFFDRQLLRGNRSRKLKSSAFDAFGSPNCPPLGVAGMDLVLHPERFLPARARQFIVPRFDPDAVAVLTIHPGVRARALDALLDSPAVRGLVLRSYGVGNVPDADQALMAGLARAVGRGVVVVNTTQCESGGVAQGAYATGAALNRIGVLSAGDMSLEAAFAKLHFLLATETDVETVKTLFGEPLCGEMS